ncbi:MAG TPA: hypothetical protein ENK44_13440 [Caldithrix abyssi]|uniref:Uncharacterized protein n=1 Tax=Caldithrix abyssi TaxID=187145 RepID=A0A7V4WVZ4_CALAY|nr:hypothetical protein [Caldithrix abyssi]
MNAARIIDAIDTFCQEALQTGYDLFGRDERPVMEDFPGCPQGRLELGGNHFQIEALNSVAISRIQIPQSRAYLMTPETDQTCYRFIQFPDFILITIRHNSPANPVMLSVKAAENWRIVYLNDVQQELFDDKLLFKTASEGIILIANEKENLSDEAIPSFLKRHLNNERKIHPFNVGFVVQNLDIMMKLDRIWAGLSALIGSDRSVQIKDNDSIETVIWLQELYLYFGWMDEWDKFHRLSRPEHNEMVLCRARFEILKGKLTTEEVVNSVEVSNEDFFLTSYLFGKPIYEESIAENLQKKWESVSVPARELFLSESIRRSPNEYIAFALLALRYNFIWAERLAMQVEKNLSGLNQRLFNALFLLNRQILFHTNGPSVQLQSGTGQANRLHLIHPRFVFKISRFADTVYSHITFTGNRFLRIDKQVSIIFTDEGRDIRIEPLFYRPPLDKLPLKAVYLYEQDKRLHIPLVWRKIELRSNSWRLRFLLKKRRFQIIVRFYDKKARIKIGEQEISAQEGIYQKVYLKADRNPGRFIVNLCDAYGNKTQKLSTAMKRVYLRGFGLDINGLLKESCNVSRNALPSSTMMGLNQSLAESIPVTSDLERIRITGRKCTPLDIPIVQTGGYARRFVDTPTGLLKYKMVIYCDFRNETLVKEIKNTVKKRLGFRPLLRDHDKIEWNRSHFIFVVERELKAQTEVIGESDFYSIFRPTAKKNISAFLIYEKNIEHLFSDAFIRKLVCEQA